MLATASGSGTGTRAATGRVTRWSSRPPTRPRRATSTGGGAAENLHPVERFTHVGPRALNFEATIIDPATWTRAWTFQVPLKKSEPAPCQCARCEGNYDIDGIFAGDRTKDSAAAVSAAEPRQAPSAVAHAHRISRSVDLTMPARRNIVAGLGRGFTLTWLATGDASETVTVHGCENLEVRRRGGLLRSPARGAAGRCRARPCAWLGLDPMFGARQ